MAGIYVHIPFCRQACSYCDFHFSTNLARQQDMVEAILQEAILRQDHFPPGTEVQSIYFGGGTPSLLTEAQLAAILDKLHALFPVTASAEITLEANPDDLDRSRLAGMARAGVNRLSIGIQSFQDHDLQLMQRSHSATQARQALEAAHAVGLDHLSLDLIYGLPGSDAAAWQANVQEALAFQPRHISAYALTVEEKTLLHHQVRQGTVVLPEDQAYQEQYFLLAEQLQAAGFEHYELSNFAVPGFRSRHNSAYWKGLPYLGLGPSAHSFRGRERAWNLANNARYLAALAQGTTPVEETEWLSDRDRLNEYLMTHLRKAEGIDLSYLQAEFSFALLEQESKKIRTFISKGWMSQVDAHLQLSLSGKMVSDMIIRELFQVDDGV